MIHDLFRSWYNKEYGSELKRQMMAEDEYYKACLAVDAGKRAEKEIEASRKAKDVEHAVREGFFTGYQAGMASSRTHVIWIYTLLDTPEPGSFVLAEYMNGTDWQVGQLFYGDKYGFGDYEVRRWAKLPTPPEICRKEPVAYTGNPGPAITTTDGR